MILILGLVILVVGVVVGVAGVLANAGGTHGMTHVFSVFGYHVTGSTGTLFLYGMVVGAAALLGLSLLLVSARRVSRRGRGARREFKQTRRTTADISKERDELVHQKEDLVHQHETASLETKRTPRTGAPSAASLGHLARLERPPRRRSAVRAEATRQSVTVDS